MLSVARIAFRPSDNSLRQTVLGLAAAILVVCAPAARSQEAPKPVVQVEEDWTLVLNDPSTTVDSPQFHTTMAPSPNVDGYYAVVTWNYYEAPDFVAGGMQLHSWDGDTEIRRRGVKTEPLSTTAETITWTQRLQTDGTMLVFSVDNGHSTTWGDFGRDMQIEANANLPDLAAYSTDTSIANSCITYGQNRVNLLVITEVRRYDADGTLVSTDTTPRIVYEAVVD
jgi:hypothetical protein